MSVPDITGRETARLRFAPLTLTHTPDLWAMENDPEVMRFLDGGRGTPWEGYEQRTHEWLERLARNFSPHFSFWAVHRRADEAFLGWFHLRPSPRAPWEGQIELGYRLRRECWGQGLASEGSRALLDYAFAEHGLPEVMALALARNAPSRRVMEKVGMAWTHDLVFPSELLPWWNEEDRRGVRYAVTAGDWRAERKEEE